MESRSGSAGNMAGARPAGSWNSVVDQLVGRHAGRCRRPGARASAARPAHSSVERADPVRRVHGELGRDPAAERRRRRRATRSSPSAVEDVEVVVDEVVDRLDLGEVVGLAEARMVGRDHLEAAGEEPEERMPRAGAAGRVQEQQRRTLAAAQDVDRAAAELEPFARALGQRAGRVGHAEKRIAHSCSLSERAVSGSLTWPSRSPSTLREQTICARPCAMRTLAAHEVA